MNDPQPEGHMASHIERRKFLAALGGSAAWPLRTRAEQVTRPAVGFLNSASADKYAYLAASFRQGLSDLGFVDGQNITIEYRWAASQYDRLSADHDSGVLSIRPLGSTNQYPVVGVLPERPRLHQPPATALAGYQCSGYRACSIVRLIRHHDRGEERSKARADDDDLVRVDFRPRQQPFHDFL